MSDKLPEIGELRDRVTIQYFTISKDTMGGRVRTWLDFVTLWANVEPLSGREYFYSQQIKAEVTHRIKTRYYAGIQNSWRVKFRDRYFRIESVLERGGWPPRFLELMCLEVKESTAPTETT